LVNDQTIFNKFDEILIANREWISQNDGEFFCDFIIRSYVVRATMAIRRHIKVKGDDVSLLKLLRQMQICSNQLTYDFYLSVHPLDGIFEWQRSCFKLLSTDGKTISSALIQNDIQTTDNINSEIEDFADRTLSHLDKKPYKGSFSWDDLNKSIDNYNRLACKYITFLSAMQYDSLKPEIAFDWENIFYKPLVKPT
jgi:hypothetical protein